MPGRHPGGFIDVDTPVGDAVVYSFGAPSGRNTSDTHLEACPVTYARYMLTSLLALRLDGVDRWDDDTARRLANGLAAYVIGPSPDLDAKYPFAAGVSGGSMVNGMPASRYAERTTIGDWSLTPFAAYSAWDESRRIAQTTAAVYRKTESDEDRPTRVYIPAGMLFAETADPWLP